MNKTSRERLSRDYVTRSAWIYDFRLWVRLTPNSQPVPRPVCRRSYTQLSLDELLRLERAEREDWEVFRIDLVRETQAIIGRSKAEFLKSPILDQGETRQLNKES